MKESTATKPKNSFYNFRNDSEIATIDIFAEIDDWWGYTANQIKADLKAFKGKKIIVNINSGGGSVTEGIAIANLLKADPRHVTTRAVGVAASIASVILLAGNTVEMAKGSFMMIHNAWAFAAGEAEDLRQTADTLDKMSNQITEIYLDAIKKNDKYDGDRAKTKKKIKDLMSKETWLSAKEAKDLGLIDKIKTFETKTSSKVNARIYNQIKKQNFQLPSNMENIKAENEEETKEEPKNGASLADALQAKIDVLLSEDEEMTQADVVQMMADAAGIEAETVNQILRGEINCPPLDRLEGFAEALSMSIDELTSAAEADGCNYGEEEETEEEAKAETTEAENKEDCKDCQKAKIEAENNSSLIQKIKNGIDKLLGRNKKEASEPSNKTEEKPSQKEADLLKEVEKLRTENKTLKAAVNKAKKSEVEALNFLKDTKEGLSKINQIKNRAGQPFQNFADLISEYQALIEHNKEVGGKPVNSGTPVSEGELTSPVEKSTGQKNKQSLQDRFSEIKRNVEAKQKKDEKKK